MEAETFPSAWCFCFDERDVIDDAVGKRKWLESPLVTLLASPAYSVRVESEANLRRRREPTRAQRVVNDDAADATWICVAGQTEKPSQQIQLYV